MGMAAGSSKGAKADINMTPLIDVLLVLLIIFMIITNEPPRGLESLVPQPPPPDAPPPPPDDMNRTVVIQVAADGSLKINEEPTDKMRMGSRLEEIFKTRAERVVFVKGDPSLEYHFVAEAIDIAKGAGIDKVGLMTPAVEEGN